MRVSTQFGGVRSIAEPSRFTVMLDGKPVPDAIMADPERGLVQRLVKDNAHGFITGLDGTRYRIVPASGEVRVVRR